ncbi:MarR family winged helix-turn-helix transcriptional regulator [Brevibacterium renqingii]|uniref:MarR family winged helix-turn-helix transcriptional regulator n=1 Tax=Brevibacterium renqingii TaxID=2776916 RepID=UPI001ADFCA56|nr:MarR family winged helix-turn-helix transcriptional regulator [Brevibacterium renqingii]
MGERTDETTPVSSQIREHGPIKVAAWRLIMEKHQDFMRQFEVGFRERHELTLNEFDTLINCLPGEEIRHRDLLRSMVLSRSALSRLLRKLEDRGLVTQAPDPEDHRGVLVGLTSAGEELREAAAKTNVEIILAGFSGLSDAAAEEVFDLVSAVRPIPPAQG